MESIKSQRRVRAGPTASKIETPKRETRTHRVTETYVPSREREREREREESRNGEKRRLGRASAKSTAMPLPPPPFHSTPLLSLHRQNTFLSFLSQGIIAFHFLFIFTLNFESFAA
jgi:hypothetical protein